MNISKPLAIQILRFHYTHYFDLYYHPTMVNDYHLDQYKYYAK